MSVSNPRTKAEADRQRRDLASGEVMDEGSLIRFVAAPDGTVAPDLGRKLPGRGMWVAADRASLETVAKKGLFSRSAKTKLTVSPGLADQVEALLRARLLAGLGLAKKAGDLISGFEKTATAIRNGKAAFLVEASDGADDGRGKLLGLVRHAKPQPRLIGVFDSDELGLALGLDNVIHLAVLAGQGADRWSADIDRLAGFRPLLPERWREEP